jgi:thioredoxin 1
MPALHANDSNFQSLVLESDQPVLVDFYADWCGPCRMMSPVVDEAADDLKGQARVVKVNVDEAPESAGRYGIQSIPAFLVFRNGEVQSSALGVASKETLIASVKETSAVA